MYWKHFNTRREARAHLIAWNGWPGLMHRARRVWQDPYGGWVVIFTERL
jgi:hypothetical protein